MYNRLVIFLSILLFFFGCSYKLDPGYQVFMVRFTNNSTSAIKDISLEMNGSSDIVQIANLGVGQTSEYHQFVLPDYEGLIPQSWGDYSGAYTIKTSVENIYIMNFDHNFRPQITVLITNVAYSFVSP